MAQCLLQQTRPLRRTVRVITWLLVLAAVGRWAPATAQDASSASVNLLTNPDFKTDASGWGSTGPSGPVASQRGWTESVRWVPSREATEQSGGAEDRPTSGSLELAITADEGSCVTIIQCIATGAGTYELSGKVLVKETEVHTRWSSITLQVLWIDRPDCVWYTPPLATGVATPVLDPSMAAKQTWSRLTTGPVVAPAGTRSAQVDLSACVSAAATSLETVVVDIGGLDLRALPSSASVHP